MRDIFYVKKLCCGIAGIYLRALQVDKMAAMWRAYTRLMERYPWGSQILQTGVDFSFQNLKGSLQYFEIHAFLSGIVTLEKNSQKTPGL